MELKWLEDFLCVAKLRNFSNAAKERHATQPALSRRIRSLEAWYGVPLIDRSTYPVELTQDGASLVPVAERIVADLNRARRDARLRAGRAQTALRFAMPHSLAVVFFPAWWRERQYAGPATVVAADFDLCVERLLEGDCQFLMCYRHTAAPDGLAARGVRGVSIGQDRLVPVSACDAMGNPLFDLRDGAARPVPLLAYPKDSFFGKVTASFEPRVAGHDTAATRYESALVDALKAEALLGEGVAWLPERTIRAELATGALKIVDAGAASTTLEIWLCQLDDATGVSVDELQRPAAACPVPVGLAQNEW